MIKKVFVDGNLIGKIYYSPQVHDNSIFINLFLLMPKYRNGGNFKILFNEMISIAKNTNVNILYLSIGGKDGISDDYLLSLYKKYGFIGDKKRMILDIRNI